KFSEDLFRRVHGIVGGGEADVDGHLNNDLLDLVLIEELGGEGSADVPFELGEAGGSDEGGEGGNLAGTLIERIVGVHVGEAMLDDVGGKLGISGHRGLEALLSEMEFREGFPFCKLCTHHGRDSS